MLVKTQPYSDQKPGTSGLRKKVAVFESKPNYLANFVQSLFDSIDISKSQSLVLGGDGRICLNKVTQVAIQLIIEMALANGVKKLIIGQHGLLSTPAISHLIRINKTGGGIILTASHNPGGPKGDFGIKYNCENGGPAPESITDQIYQKSLKIEEFKKITLPKVDLSILGSKTVLGEDASMEIEIVSSVSAYVAYMREIFDFELIKTFLTKRKEIGKAFKIVFDAMSGVTGPYAREIFVNVLGMDPETCLLNCEPQLDFGGGHPDPNLTYAATLVQLVKTNKVDLGAASDGDGDRNMIIAHDTFVTPSDSVAVIAHNAHTIPFFKKHPILGLARSMPTSQALDLVAKQLGVPFFEVPTGWKFFGNLMDANTLSICGEESFGTGSCHVREKDGIWAVLAWLNILAWHGIHQNLDVSVGSLLQQHYQTFGRHFFTRYDYEEVEDAKATSLMKQLLEHIPGITPTGASWPSGKRLISLVNPSESYTLATLDEFTYTDPIDHSVSKHQGLRLIFEDGSRIIYRLSGTGSSGATIRVYIEKYVKDEAFFNKEVKEVLKGLIEIAVREAKIQEWTGRDAPDVVT